MAKQGVFKKTVYQDNVFDFADKEIAKTVTILQVINEIMNLKSKIPDIFQTDVFQENVFQTIQEAITILGRVKTVTESISISDVLDLPRLIVRMIDETLSVSDGFGRLRQIVRSISDSISISDVFSRSRGLVRSITSSISLSETNKDLEHLLDQLQNRFQFQMYLVEPED